MPVYEYRCGACGQRFSKLFRSVSAAADQVACPACKQAGAERTLSAFAYHPSLKTRIESIDPQIEKELDWADSKNEVAPLSRLNLDYSSAGNDD